MDALNRFVAEKPSGYLYHYTGVSGVLGILRGGSIWATDYRHLNDRKEYRIGANLLRAEMDNQRLTNLARTGLLRFIEETQNTCFVLSFSECGDQLSQWRAYCHGGIGYALGFKLSNSLFHSARQHQFNLVRCEYDLQEQKNLCRYLVESYMEGMFTKQSWRPSNADESARVHAFFKRYQWGLALALVTSALKHSGFQEEREWRLVSQYPEDLMHGVAFRPGRFGITPYFELPLSANEGGPRGIDEIVVGPNPNQSASRAAINLLLKKYNVAAGKIKTSQTPLRF